MSGTTVADDRNGALLAWYATHRRPLPWRVSQAPYPILVAEVMSQQTQIERVVVHWEEFMNVFPDLETLAAAPLSDVLRAWSGLGYNARAKRLHATAKAIVELGWPTTSEALQALPGVGPYTAKAIAAFAFDEPSPAIDTNLKRVLSRWHGESLAGKALEIAANDAIADDAATWNQAVMDLGAVLCRPRSPRCDACPVDEWCAGPDVYSPPEPQTKFEGSHRQIRGAVIRHLVRGAASLEDAAASTGFAVESVGAALEDLVAEGLVELDADRYRLAD